MADDVERKIAALGPTPDSDDERIFRIAWPYHPAYFGIRIIEDPDELDEAIGGETPADMLERMKGLVGEGMRLLILEAPPAEIGTFVRIMAQAGAAARPEGRS